MKDKEFELQSDFIAHAHEQKVLAFRARDYSLQVTQDAQLYCGLRTH